MRSISSTSAFGGDVGSRCSMSVSAMFVLYSPGPAQKITAARLPRHGDLLTARSGISGMIRICLYTQTARKCALCSGASPDLFLPLSDEGRESCGSLTNLYIAWRQAFPWSRSPPAPASGSGVRVRTAARGEQHRDRRGAHGGRGRALHRQPDKGYFAQQGLTVKIVPITAASTAWATCRPARRSSSRGTTSRSSSPRSPAVRAQPGPAKSDRHAPHRRLVADAGGQPGALRDAQARRTRPCRTW